MSQVRMKLTTVYLGDTERKALVRLAKATGNTKSECLRAAIREASRLVADKRLRSPVCEREGYQIRDINNVLRCDSGEYEDREDGAVRCVRCHLPAA